MTNSKYFGIAAIIVAISLGYYFVVFIPQEKAKSELSNNIEACTRLEDKVYNTYLEQLLTPAKRGETSSQNHFDQRLNKCFVEVSDLSCGPYCVSSVQIFDAAEDRMLAYCSIPVGNNPLKGNETCSDLSINPDGVQITSDEFHNLEKNYLYEK